MENNWPETVEELLEECQRLISKYDLYTLGNRGEPYAGEDEPRVYGTDYLAGEYQYGVAMIPAQWVTHVLSAATLGSGTCEEYEHDGRYECPECGCVVYYDLLADDSWTIYMDDYQIPFNACPNCGKAVKR